MKTNQIVMAVLCTTFISMGCKKNDLAPANNYSNAATAADAATQQSQWITDASKDGIGGQLTDADLRDWIKPENFVQDINNLYLPLNPGDTFYYQNTVVDGGIISVEDITVSVTHDIKIILGINCKVIHDYVEVEGKVVEDTYDWYAQDIKGNVWYFGEDTKKYDSDSTYSTEGSFTAGVDGARPGVVMPGKPLYGYAYRQEYYPGHAEDQGMNLSSNNTVVIGYGTYTNCLKTVEYTVLDPGVLENKYYAPGIGLIQTVLNIGGKEHEELVGYVHY